LEGMSYLEWLQHWYKSNCDDCWEHTYGISISTLDNPGWAVDIDLADTPFEEIEDFSTELDQGETDWLSYRVRDKKFWARGDESKLNEIIARFQELCNGLQIK